MNLNSLKLGFTNYLEQISELSNKDYYTSNADISIFMYSNEFKNYIMDEVVSDPKVQSMSINEILDMEIQNGKLIDPSEEATENSEGRDVETEATSQEAQTTQPEENMEAYGENPTVLMGEEDVIDTLNAVMEMDEVKAVIDENGDSEVSNEEVQTFINAIKGYDGDGENVSLEDILGAVKAIWDGEFSLDPEKAEEKELEVKEKKEAEQAQAAQRANGASPSYGSGSFGGVGGQIGSQGVQEKTLENMSKEELNSELNTAESDLADKQSKLSDVISGNDPVLEGLKEAEEEAYETYHEELEKVDKDMAKDLDNLKNEVDEKEAAVDEQEQAIADQESVVSDCETAYNNAVSTTQTLETSLSALESTDTSNMDSEKKSELSSKISELKTKIAEAKEAEQQAKDDWDAAEEELDSLKEEKKTLEEELNESTKNMETLEADISKKYPEIQEYMDAYKEAKDEYKTTKQEAITTAKSDVEESQEYVNEVKTAISNYDNRQTAKEYCFGAFGEDILEFAKQFIGANESDGSANKFLGGASAAEIPWCAAFVEYIMENSGNYENVPDWYKNIDNKWYCPNIDSAANANGAIINGQEAQQGDIVLFDWDGDGTKDHIGIVDTQNGSTVVTIEGNTSNQVAQRTYDINDPRLTFCKVVA